MALPRQKPQAKPLGRYNLDGATVPANGLGRPAPSQNVRTAVGAVKDPYSTTGERTLVAINGDLLDRELRQNPPLITEAAFHAGRLCEAVFERAGGRPGSSNWQGGSRVDAWVAHELSILHGIEEARKLEAFMAWMQRELGMIDARLLRRVLGEGRSYAEVAALQGKAGENGRRYIAARFRDALEALADAKAAKGRDHAKQRNDAAVRGRRP